MNETLPGAGSWWRWPLVPVASIAAAAIAAVALATLQEFAVSLQDSYAKDGWFHLFVYPVIPCAIAGYQLAAVATLVAPSAKRRAGVAMTVIMAFVLIAFTAFCWSINAPPGDAIQVTMATLAAIAGAMLALWHARKDASRD